MSILWWVTVLSIAGAAGVALGPALVSARRSPLDVASRAGWVTRLLQLAEDASAAGQPAIAAASRALIDALVGEPRSSSKGK